MTNKILERSANSNSYKADAGESDTGWLPGGDVRTLGLESGKPEPWFDKLEFEQVDFPVADHIYGKGKKAELSVIKTAIIKETDELIKMTKLMFKELVR